MDRPPCTGPTVVRMSIHTASRGTTRLRVAAAVAAPVLALCVACGGGDDGVKDEGVASAPEEPTAASGKDEGEGKGEGGASKPAAEGKSAFYDAQLTYVRCMRAKAGLKDYPDPKLSGYLDWSKIEKLVDPNGGGEEYKGGKNGVCNKEFVAAANLWTRSASRRLSKGPSRPAARTPSAAVRAPARRRCSAGSARSLRRWCTTARRGARASRARRGRGRPGRAPGPPCRTAPGGRASSAA